MNHYGLGSIGCSGEMQWRLDHSTLCRVCYDFLLLIVTY